ncbi:MAG: hypothetical protein HN527_16035, partial [Rhodospirillaceae bacterium]|nr:hypothetical protein [Rhodospirillaceae bacterium]
MNSAVLRPRLAAPLFMLFVTGVAYGLTYSLAGVSVRGGIPFTAYVFWLGVVAGVVMFVLALLFR